MNFERLSIKFTDKNKVYIIIVIGYQPQVRLYYKENEKIKTQNDDEKKDTKTKQFNGQKTNERQIFFKLKRHDIMKKF